MRTTLLRCAIGYSMLVSALVSAETTKPDIINQVEQSLAAEQESVVSRVPVLVVAPIETTLVSPMFGRVNEHNLSLGSSFSKGDLLVSFICSDRRAQVELGGSELDAAQIRYENKLKLQGLSQAGEIEVTLAANEVSRAKAQSDYYKALLFQCSIVAPFDGRVSDVKVAPHQGVNQGEPIADIISTTGLKARMNIPATWLKQVSAGTPVILSIDDTGNSYSATVSAINSRVDSVSHTVEIEAEIIDPTPELLAGMSGTAEFQF